MDCLLLDSEDSAVVFVAFCVTATLLSVSLPTEQKSLATWKIHLFGLFFLRELQVLKKISIYLARWVLVVAHELFITVCVIFSYGMLNS